MKLLIYSTGMHFFVFRPLSGKQKKQILCALCGSAVIITCSNYNAIPHLKIRVLSFVDRTRIFPVVYQVEQGSFCFYLFYKRRQFLPVDLINPEV